MTADIVVILIVLIVVGYGCYFVPKVLRMRHRREEVERREAPQRDLTASDEFLEEIAKARTDAEIDQAVIREQDRRRRTE